MKRRRKVLPGEELVERFSNRGDSKCKGPGVETSLKDFQSVLLLSPKHGLGSQTSLGSIPGFAAF